MVNCTGANSKEPPMLRIKKEISGAVIDHQILVNVYKRLLILNSARCLLNRFWTSDIRDGDNM